MPSQRKSSRGGASSPAVPVNEERELIVVTTPAAGLRAAREALTSLAGADVDPLNEVLRESGATMVPVFGNEDRVARTLSESGAMFEVPQVANLTSFYRVVADDEKLDDIAGRLLETEVVESAFVKPPAFPPVIIDEDMRPPSPEPAPPATPSFNARQIYLDAAPAGIDARFAATVAGGKGQGVRIIDIEGAWRFSHEDLVQNQGGVIGGVQSGDIAWRDHGTAVIGEFGGDDNAFGITGICPLANTRAISIFGANMGSAKAITDAANALSPGDIILIELHRPGPRHNFQQRPQDQLGYIAIEWWPDDFAAIVFATSVRGVIVVEAAGNGAENLDDAIYNNRPAGFPVTWRNPFNLANPQSGAVIVGAGAPPPGTHGRNHGADRSRLGFSNFAARVDVQGWGREVTTAGYGDLQGGGNEDLWYTDTFSGTSSASPIVVGAVGCMQGALRAANKPLLTPATARNILRTTGSPQQDEPGRPATQRIGNRPNLRQAFGQLGLSAKSIIKEVKNEKIEIKERLKDQLKERIKDKIEIKEQIKERKDKPETKELIKDKDKEKEKEKEKEKDIKDIKDKEKENVKDFKDIRDGLGGVLRPEMGGPSGPGGDLESRVSALEQTVGELSHFISGELRPDLQSSALSGEEDLMSLSQQLQQQANDAKSAKDNKDIEKLRES